MSGNGPYSLGGFKGKGKNVMRSQKPSNHKGSGSAPKSVIWIITGVLGGFGTAVLSTLGYIVSQNFQ